MKYLPILLCVLLTLVSWGAQSSLLNRSQGFIGPWKTMMVGGVGNCVIAILVGLLGLYLFGSQQVMTPRGAVYGLSAGIAGSIGVAGITFAFTLATRSGNTLGSAWISPAIGGLLPAFYVLMAVVLLEKPKDGWGQLLSPGYLSGLVFVILGVVLLTINRPK